MSAESEAWGLTKTKGPKSCGLAAPKSAIAPPLCLSWSYAEDIRKDDGLRKINPLFCRATPPLMLTVNPASDRASII